MMRRYLARAEPAQGSGPHAQNEADGAMSSARCRAHRSEARVPLREPHPEIGCCHRISVKAWMVADRIEWIPLRSC